jgi:hypothetical protein
MLRPECVSVEIGKQEAEGLIAGRRRSHMVSFHA